MKLENQNNVRQYLTYSVATSSLNWIRYAQQSSTVVIYHEAVASTERAILYALISKSFDKCFSIRKCLVQNLGIL